jgi:RHS repeat-associated protein
MSGSLAEANVYRFSSKEFHEASGLLQYLYRYYDSRLLRWVKRDDIGEIGGINLYAYVGNNPVSEIDFFGLSQQDVKRIKEVGRSKIDKMTAAGERTGNGAAGAAWNNITAWFTKRLGCAAQSDRVLAQLLLPLNLDDTWTFSHVETALPLFHQFIIAHSSNPTD